MSVAELERMYGRNAQVELRNPPTYQQEPVYQQEPGYQNYHPEPAYQAGPPYYDPDAYDDPVETPVKRSPWLPVVVVMMLGIGGVLGYGLYNRGLIPAQLAQLMPARVAMQKTESLPIERDWKGLPALPHISTGVVTNISAATPSAPAPATKNSDTPGAAAGPAARPMTSTEDNAATLEMIRRERERLDDPGGTQQPTTTGEATEAEPAVPGYIEAETP